MATGPALIAGRVLNAGYVSAAQVVQGLLPPPAPGPGNPRGEPQQLATLDVEVSPTPHASERDSLEGDPEAVKDPDDGTNLKLMADNGATNLSDGAKLHPRLFNADPASRSGGAPSLTTVRKSIRDAIHGLREGVRNTVKAATGRGDDNSADAPGDTGESPQK